MSKRGIILVFVSVAILFMLYGAAYAFMGSGIPRGASVNGVAIGGMDRPAALSTLERAIALPASIKVVARQKAATINPNDSGITLDFETTVDTFPKRTTNPWELVRYFVSGRSKTVAIRIEQQALLASLQSLRLAVTDLPREGNIAFQGTTPIGIRPIDGTDLDLQGLAKKIRAGIFAGQTRFYAQVVPVKAMGSWESIQETIETFAKPAVSAPITINLDGHLIDVAPEIIADSLQFTPLMSTQGEWIDKTIVKDKLIADLGTAWSQWVLPPRNASFKTVNGKLEVIPSAVGRDVPAEKLSDAIISILTKTQDRIVDVTSEEVKPKLTTEEALGLNLSDRIGNFTTHFPWTWYRAHNIHRAADILNGTIVKPGEIFSLNQTLGQRTEENGFVEGVVISGGRLAKDWGGGVSQISTTTYNAAWFAGLKILQHKPHSFYISRYPVGRESTLSWPDVDMKFQNDTGHPIVITTGYYSNNITVSIYGTRKYNVETITGPRTNSRSYKAYEDDSKTCINQGGIGGFDIKVTRVLSENGVEARREVYSTRYLSEDKIVCTNPEATFGNVVPPKPKPKPKPTPTLTPTPIPSL